LVVAYRQIFRPVAACRPGEVCAVPHVRTTYKALFGLVVVLLTIALSYPFVAPYFY
jgi:mercuric ion transport protein